MHPPHAAEYYEKFIERHCVLIVWLMTTFWANHNNYMNLVIIIVL